MKKILIIALPLILIVTFLYLGKTAIVSTTGNTFAEKIASKIPEKHKEFLKNNNYLLNEVFNKKLIIKGLSDIVHEGL